MREDNKIETMEKNEVKYIYIESLYLLEKKCKARKGRATIIEELKQWLTPIAANKS